MKRFSSVVPLTIALIFLTLFMLPALFRVFERKTPQAPQPLADPPSTKEL